MTVNQPHAYYEDRNRSIIASFTLAERLLYALSRPVDEVAREGGRGEAISTWRMESALSDLIRAYPDLYQIIANRTVLDYGCGDGFQSVAMARSGAKWVVGCDIAEGPLVHARRLAGGLRNVEFVTKVVEAQFDVTISLNAFEHFPYPGENLAELISLTKPGGLILISFGPLWFAPYGAHMSFFTKVPWVNILFSEKTTQTVRQLYRDGGTLTYSDMNRMTVRKFERLIRNSGLITEQLCYHTVKNLPVLGKVPFVRELFVNAISGVFRRPCLTTRV